MRFSFEVIPEQPIAELLDAIELADRLGFHGCYSADETYHKDMWALFGAAAARTDRIVLAPGVTHVILKDPTIVAQSAATLDELTGGRTEVVFSVGNIAMLEQYGVEWRPRMLARLREAHHVLRTFLDNGEIDFEGDFYRYRGLFTAARTLAAFYIPSMPSVLLERHGIAPESVRPIVAAFGSGDVAEAVRLTSDDVADRISIAGTPDDWVERLRADVLPSGLDHLIVVPADPFLTHSWAGVQVDGLPDLAGQLRLLHDEVMPVVAA